MADQERDSTFTAALDGMDRAAMQVERIFVAAAVEYLRTGRPLDAERAAGLTREVERLQKECDVYAGIARRLLKGVSF